MSLQVWLPLNGTTENQGLSNIQMLGSPNSWSTNGKIGKCANFSGNLAKVIYNNTTEFNYTDNFSWALWVNTNYPSATAYIFTNGRADAGGYGYGLQNNSTTTCFARFGNIGYTINVIGGEWTHLAFTKEGTTIKIYKNGTLYSTNTFNGTLPTYSDGNGLGIGCFHYSGDIYPYYGSINDFRIYDHCLSAKEVKEISKGLVLHYKLDSGLNKIIPSDYQEVEYLESSGTQYINTNYVATSYPLELKAKMSWLTAPSSEKDFWGNFNATTQTSSAYCFVCGGRGTDKWYQWGGSVWEPVSNLATNIIYETDFIYTGTSGRKTEINGILAENTSISNGNALATTDGYIGLFSGAGKRAYCCGSFRIYRATIINNNITVRDFIPCYRKSDNVAGMYDVITNTFFTNQGTGTFTLGPNIVLPVYDNSGHNNNGQIIGTPTFSTDSSRYNSSINFNGTDNGILIENLFISDIINTAITYSFWIKPNGENGARSVYFGSYSGTSWSIEKSAGNVLRLYWNGSPDENASGATITDGVWQHVCITKNGTNDIKVYINGIQKWVSTATHSNLTFPTTYRIGRDVRTNDGTPYKGLMNDFRIYATALSADDVLELYQTSASIGKNGNIYAYELEEV